MLFGDIEFEVAYGDSLEVLLKLDRLLLPLVLFVGFFTVVYITVSSLGVGRMEFSGRLLVGPPDILSEAYTTSCWLSPLGFVITALPLLPEQLVMSPQRPLTAPPNLPKAPLTPPEILFPTPLAPENKDDIPAAFAA